METTNNSLKGKNMGLPLQFLTDQKGHYYYADKKMRSDNFPQNCDSMEWLTENFLKEVPQVSKINYYNLNPFTNIITTIEKNGEDDFSSVEKWCENIDWKNIFPSLIIKEIVNPFSLKGVNPTDKDVENLKKWVSFVNLINKKSENNLGTECCDVRGTLAYNAQYSRVTSYVARLLFEKTRDTSLVSNVMDKISHSLQENIIDSIWDNIYIPGKTFAGSSVRDSTMDILSAYSLSFFNVEYDPEFSCIFSLLEKGLVPSFYDGSWRLHFGIKAESMKILI